jgi:hypothetical protein
MTFEEGNQNKDIPKKANPTDKKYGFGKKKCT